MRAAAKAGVEQRIIRTVIEVNDSRKSSMAGRVKSALGGSLTGKRVAVLGLAFKPNTDDMRDAPSIQLIEGLVAGGAQVIAYDPVANEQARMVMPDLEIAPDVSTAANGADALVIITEWDEFRALDLSKLALCAAMFSSTCAMSTTRPRHKKSASPTSE